MWSLSSGKHTLCTALWDYAHAQHHLLPLPVFYPRLHLKQMPGSLFDNAVALGFI